MGNRAKIQARVLERFGERADLTPVPTGVAWSQIYEPRKEKGGNRKYNYYLKIARAAGIPESDAEDAISQAVLQFQAELGNEPVPASYVGDMMRADLKQIIVQRASDISRRHGGGVPGRKRTQAEKLKEVASGKRAQRYLYDEPQVVMQFQDDDKMMPKELQSSGFKKRQEARIEQYRGAAIIMLPREYQNIMLLKEQGLSEKRIASVMGFTPAEFAAKKREAYALIDQYVESSIKYGTGSEFDEESLNGGFGVLGEKQGWVFPALAIAAVGGLLWFMSRKNKEG